MANVIEINGVWYLDDNGTKINLYASGREDAEKRATEITAPPKNMMSPPAGSLADYTDGSYDRNQTVATKRRGKRGAR